MSKVEKYKGISEIIKNIAITGSLLVGVYISLWGKGDDILVDTAKSKKLDVDKKKIEHKKLNTELVEKKLDLIKRLRLDMKLKDNDYRAEARKERPNNAKMDNIEREIYLLKRKEISELNEIRLLMENLVHD